MNRITCPHCESKIKVKPELAGRRVSCPKCNGQFQIPVVEASVEAVAVVEPPIQPVGLPVINTGLRVTQSARPSIKPVTIVALGILAVILGVPCLCAGLIIIGGDGGAGGAPSTVLTAEEWAAFRWPVELDDMTDEGLEFRWVNEGNGYFYRDGESYKAISYQDGRITSVSLYEGDEAVRREYFYPDGSTEELHENHRYTHFFENGKKEWELVTGDRPYVYSTSNRYWDETGKELTYEQYCEKEFGPDWQEKVTRWGNSDIEQWKKRFEEAMERNAP